MRPAGSTAVLRLAIVLAVGVAVVAVAAQTTRYLDGGRGVDSGDCSSAAAPCLTIMYAHDHAARGDRMQLSGDFHLAKTNMIVESLSWRGPARLFCDGVVRNALYFTSSFSDVQDLEFSGCTGTTLVYDYESLSCCHSIDNIYIHHSFVGVGAVSANMSISNSRFESITQGAVIHSLNYLRVLNSTFVNNTFGVYQPSCAAAIHTVRSDVVLSNVHFEGHPPSAPECVLVHVGLGVLLAQNVRWLKNELTLLQLWDVPNADIRDSTMLANIVTDRDSAVAAENSVVSLHNSQLRPHAGRLFALSSRSSLTLTDTDWHRPSSPSSSSSASSSPPVLACASPPEDLLVAARSGGGVNRNAVVTRGRTPPFASSDASCAAECQLTINAQPICPARSV